MIELVQSNRFEVETPTGFKSFSGIRRTTKSEVLCITFEDKGSLKCSLDHRFIVEGEETLAKDIKEGTYLSKTKLIKSIKRESYSEYLYDLVNVGDDSLYLVEDIISHNCDFSTSGNTVIYPEILNWYQLNTVREPKEKRGREQEYWLFDYPDPMKTYMLIADVARGDGQDFSAFHIMEVDSLTQVAEYKCQVGTKEFAQTLIAAATEWNNALLVVENANIGWDVVIRIQEAGYSNLYYSPKTELVGTQIDLYVAKYDKGDGMVPGFGTTSRTRPLVIEKARSFTEDKQVVIRSQRLLDELRVFIWKGRENADARAQAMQGYNDDLVMSWFIGLFLRDTALRFRQTAIDLTYASLNGYHRSGNDFQIYTPKPTNQENPWKMQAGDEYQDITWLL
jgi:hypothetical protein